jgi:DNA processing protein
MLVEATVGSGHVLDEMARSQGRRGPGARGGYVPPPAESRRSVPLLDLIGPRRSVSSDQQPRLFADGHATSDRGPTLYYAGDAALVASPLVAIVGTRDVSPAGAARAERLARELVEAHVVVVSGLAKGVDTHALTSAIKCGGRTIAVIGTPLDKAYPAENKRLQELIYREHLLVSPFADGEVVQKHFFPRRNKVMAALSDATVIIEASDTSGTLHQAAECTRLRRWLFIAKSLFSDSRVTWPSKFMSYERTRVLERTEDLIAVL